MTIGELVYKITGDSTQLKTEVAKSDKAVQGLGGSFSKFAALGVAAFGAVAVAGAAKLGKELITLAADANESINAVQVVFGEASDGILAFSENSVQNLGLSSTAFNELSTVIGAQLKQAGTDVGVLDDKVIELSTRAADVASVFNVDVNESLQAFGSALRGEAEPARRFGVNISDAAVQAEALASGLVKNKNEITDQIKIQARYNIILKQTNDLAGDFENTQDSLTNQLKIAQSGLAEYGKELGQNLLPIATTAVTTFNKIVTALIDQQREFNNLKSVIAEFQETGAVTGTLDELLAKREAILAQRQKAGREGSFIANEELEAINAAIAAEERRLEQQKIINGFNAQAAEGERLAAEQAAKEAEEDRIRAEQRLKDIEFRNAVWGRTEEARRAAIEAEIAELETFKESDVKAQEALAFLREELARMTEDTEEATKAMFVYGDEIDDLTAANDRLHESISGTSEETQGLFENLLDAETAAKAYATTALGGFYDVGVAMVNNTNAAAALGSAVLTATSDVLSALGAELAARAAVALLAGDVAGAIAGGAASAAAFVASGAIGAAANNITSTPTAPTTTSETTETTTTTGTTSGSGGGTLTVEVPVYLDGEKIAIATAPFLISELERRGDF